MIEYPTYYTHLSPDDDYNILDTNKASRGMFQ